jgi:hypothetical protein
VSKKVSDIHEENFTINIEHFSDIMLRASNFFAINAMPTSNILDDNHRNLFNFFLQISNFLDRAGLSQK